ncbi:MAG: hypothetical protein ABIJ47_15240 [Candidatus Bathyarchaeota archaeon]
MGFLSGSRRELPIYFIGIIVFAIIASGYLDNVLWLVLLSVLALIGVYIVVNPYRNRDRYAAR